jgi:hypothetical protein
MTCLKKIFPRVLLLFTLWLFLFPGSLLTVYAEEEDGPVVIVIDPGHSGENLGAQYDGYTEKEMTAVVAYAMKEELEKYDNVVVYLTHETDVDMSIKNRAVFAKEKNADFLFCLHFNSSVNHNLYGSEIWVSAFGDYYVSGRQFAEINMQLFEEMGLFSRGIKTRMNDNGDNYYGILRYCTELGVNAALIEHCHLDNERDIPFYQMDEEQLKEFGRKDAEAAAKYFGLKSSETGVDYSDYPKKEIPWKDVVLPDKTAPEECSIELLSVDAETGIATVSMHAVDEDSYIQYYCYSLDGGNTYSELEGWPRKTWDSSEEECVFTVQLPFEQEIELRGTAYNGYDVFTESSIITIPALALPEETAEPEETLSPAAEDEYQEITFEPPEEKQESPIGLLVFILLFSAGLTAVFYGAVRLLLVGKRKRNKGH